MIKGGPKIIKDGLVLCLDAHDAKSYAGEPVTNLYGDMSTSSSLRGNRTEYNTGGTWPSDMPMCPEPVGRVYKHTSGALTSSWSGNSYGYMHKDISTTSGLMYTLTFWVYLSPDCDIDYMQSSIEGATSNYGSWTGYPQQYDFTKKGTWQLLSRHATADTSVRFLIYPGHTGVTDGSFSGFFAWGGMQVVQAEYVTPFVLSSRSATDGWVDRTTNNNDGTLSNMIGTGASHYRDGQVIMPVANSYLDFDGTNDIVTISSPSFTTINTHSVCAWVNTDDVTGWRTIIDFDNDEWLLALNNKNFTTYDPTFYSGYYLTAGKWHHLCRTHESGGPVYLYLDGALVYTSTNVSVSKTFSKINIGAGLSVGSSTPNELWAGKIAQVQLYSRKLSTAEVLSNYNTTKSRFS